MDHRVLQELLRAKPFVPFRILVTDGVWYEIRHAAMAAVSRRTIELGMPIEEGNQRFLTISLVHVIYAEVVRTVPTE